MIVEEELDHFRQVLDLLEARGMRFRRLEPSSYGRQLNDLARKQEPGKAVDRLLVAGLIEARSCERFALLKDRLPDRELSGFYASLFESEARHHATYVRLAMLFDKPDAVLTRLEELSAAEAEIIDRGDSLARCIAERGRMRGCFLPCFQKKSVSAMPIMATSPPMWTTQGRRSYRTSGTATRAPATARTARRSPAQAPPVRPSDK